MVMVPIRGLFLLGRTAAVVLAAAAVPVLVKKSKPLAKKLGQEVEKIGKWLQDESVVASPKASPPKESAKAETAASASADGAASKPHAAKTRTTAKKPTARQRTANAKPKPKAPPVD